MRKQLPLIIILLLTACGILAKDTIIPKSIQTLINKQASDKKYPFEVFEYKYKLNTVYVFMGTGCCDLPGTLYNSKGEVICNYVGYANYWNPPCENFKNEALLVKKIYSSKS